jgi:hypothetical protein
MELLSLDRMFVHFNPPCLWDRLEGQQLGGVKKMLLHQELPHLGEANGQHCEVYHHPSIWMHSKATRKGHHWTWNWECHWRFLQQHGHQIAKETPLGFDPWEHNQGIWNCQM